MGGGGRALSGWYSKEPKSPSNPPGHIPEAKIREWPGELPTCGDLGDVARGQSASLPSYFLQPSLGKNSETRDRNWPNPCGQVDRRADFRGAQRGRQVGSGEGKEPEWDEELRSN